MLGQAGKVCCRKTLSLSAKIRKSRTNFFITFGKLEILFLIEGSKSEILQKWQKVKDIYSKTMFLDLNQVYY